MNIKEWINNYLERRKYATAIFQIGYLGYLLRRKVYKLINAKFLTLSLEREIEEIIVECKTRKFGLLNNIRSLIDQKPFIQIDELNELQSLEIATIHDCQTMANILSWIGTRFNMSGSPGPLMMTIMPMPPYINIAELGITIVLATVIVGFLRLT